MIIFGEGEMRGRYVADRDENGGGWWIEMCMREEIMAKRVKELTRKK